MATKFNQGGPDREKGHRRLIGWIAFGVVALVAVISLLLFARRGGEEERLEIVLPVATIPFVRTPDPVFSPSPLPLLRPSPSPSVPPTLPDAVSSLGFRPGDRLVYDFSQNYKLAVSSRPVPAASESSQTEPPAESVEVEMGQEGQLKVEVYSMLSSGDDRGWLIGFRLSGLEFKSGDGLAPDDPAQAEIVWEATQGGVLAEVLESGRIRRITASSLFSAEARTLWKDILARWQVILPDDPAVRNWEEMEDDVTGKYLARYTWGEAGPPRRLIKRKLRYHDISLPEGEDKLSPKSSVQGETEIDLNPYQVLIVGREAARFQGPAGASVVSDASFKFVLLTAEYSPLDEQETQRMQEMMNSSPDELSWAAESLSTDELARVKSIADTEEIFSNLEDLFRRGGARSGRHVELAAELISEIRSGNSQALETIMDTLACGAPVSEDSAEEYSATLIGVLGAAGTPEAQRSLLDIIASPDWPTDLRAMALQSLVQVENPIREIDPVLEDLYLQGGEDYSDSAFMVLAAMGERLRETDLARRDEIGQFILRNLSGVDPTDQMQMTLALATIANLGPEKIPGIVVDALAGEDAYLREQAVLSLERIQTAAADELITAASTDPEEEVRMAAVQMLGDPNRASGLVSLRRVVMNDLSSNVRLAGVMGISRWSQADGPAAIALLREVAERDSSSDVRQTAVSQIEFLLADQWSDGTSGSPGDVTDEDVPSDDESAGPPAHLLDPED